MTSQASASGSLPTDGRAMAGNGTSLSNQRILLAAFFIVTLLPVKPLIGGQRMDPERLFLLVAFLPFAIRMLSGRAGRLTMVDAGMVLFNIWLLISFLVNHGTSQLSYAISQVLELAGGYMAGRVLVRSVAEYQRFVRYFLITLAVMLPFGLIELFTSHMLLSEILGKVLPVVQANGAVRYGLTRVQVVFPHAILYGLYCSIALSSVYFVYRARPFRMWTGLGLVFVTTLMSLSSAPMLSIILQTGLIVWNKITRGAWATLAGLFGAAVAILQLFSNRGPVVFFIETMTLDPQTGWWRIYIWNWGTFNVMQHPLFGIGLNDWVRPKWMISASVDNFWLLIAMRNGLPALVFLLSAVLVHLVLVIRARNLTEAGKDVRLGYALTLIGLIFLLTTVHVWDEVATFVFFFFGIGAFLYTAPAETPDAGDPTVPAKAGTQDRRTLPFTRYPTQRGSASTRSPHPAPALARKTRP